MLINWPLLGELLLRSVVLTFMLVGLIGLVIPIFPGIVVIWLAALAYAVTEAMSGGVSIWGWLLFGLITVLMIVGNVVDEIIMARKLRETGTPWGPIALGFTAGIVASFFLTPFAALFITPLALYLAELYRLRDWREALRSTKGWLIGTGWSFLAVFGIGLVMILLWVLWAWVVH
jgi:uncharacterized protein YqgC (DUF456 family)